MGVGNIWSGEGPRFACKHEGPATESSTLPAEAGKEGQTSAWRDVEDHEFVFASLSICYVQTLTEAQGVLAQRVVSIKDCHEGVSGQHRAFLPTKRSERRRGHKG